VQKIIEIGLSLLKLFNIKLVTLFETRCIIADSMKALHELVYKI